MPDGLTEMVLRAIGTYEDVSLTDGVLRKSPALATWLRAPGAGLRVAPSVRNRNQ